MMLFFKLNLRGSFVLSLLPSLCALHLSLSLLSSLSGHSLKHNLFYTISIVVQP